MIRKEKNYLISKCRRGRAVDAVVLKTIGGKTLGGSNPSVGAKWLSKLKWDRG